MAEHDSNTAPDLAHSEFYSYVDCHSLYLRGAWMARSGFIDGMPVKIRVMRDCIIITPQHTRELFGCIEGMSVTRINKKKVVQWLKTFPGALNDTGDIPVIKRDRIEGGI
ncbi:SymE family type I addiction module toxin [Escherichia coli]|nr:type I toxin-antitoxin system SymE family toxin [Escherichia coli]EFD4962029.1 type I toxin-antitoxin system SymE family toxin [Escherichia coli]EGF7348234.1 type I toxin-antitoxin system SymE family toxin [Escherichia coli]EGF7413177.1 type I toxin-antitoxin system SymE family toxin [Escherichia coli]EGF7454299.1 type I toxin-antitoxin system SymE family toxin [Escherichia coli]